MNTIKKNRVVIIGGGVAGVSAIAPIRQASDAEIALVTSESGLPYYRINLTRYLAGEVKDSELPLHPREWYEHRRVNLIDGIEAVGISGPDVILSDSRRLPFDRLILSAGARAVFPDIPGVELPGVFALRTKEDADRILEAVKGGASCAVIGGGILGLETAGAIARRGGKVALLERHEWPMPRQLNRRAGELLESYLNKAGISLIKRASAERIEGDFRASGVRLKGGILVPADFVVVTIGICPNLDLARRSGVRTGKGVIVDDFLLTSRPGVLAAGDMAEHRGIIHGTWSAARLMGGIAGMNASGSRVEFGGIPRSNALKVLGLDLISAGQFEPYDASCRVVERESDGCYARLLFGANRLAGSILMGDTSMARKLKNVMEEKTDFSDLLRSDPKVEDVFEYIGGEKPGGSSEA